MKFWESNHQSVQEGDMQFIALYKFYYQDLYAYGVSLGLENERLTCVHVRSGARLRAVEFH